MSDFAEPTEDRARLDSAVDLGVKASRFLDSEVGRAIQSKYLDARQAALEALATADASNPAEILRLQTQVRAVDLTITWFHELLDEAVAAHNALGDFEPPQDEG